jgi:hypothetical protein
LFLSRQPPQATQLAISADVLLFGFNPFFAGVVPKAVMISGVDRLDTVIGQNNDVEESSSM